MENIHYIILMVGVLVGLSLLVKAALGRIQVPPLVGWILIGVLCRAAGQKWGFLDDNARRILEFFAEVGVITLLFKIGMESKLEMLVKQLKKASVIWAGNVIISGLFGYLAAYYLCGLSREASLIIAVAFTATSVGVTVKTWEETKQLKTPRGQLLLDLAEMDDVSGIIFMGFLFAVMPLLEGFSGESIGSVIGKTSMLFVLRMTLFSGLCLGFARFAEKPLLRFVRKLEHGPDPMITVIGMGFIIAAIAAMLQFSVALGAFFAGLAFSGDKETVKQEALFTPLYEFFSPFFFIGIGLAVSTSAITASLLMGGILFTSSFAGKIAGTALPALLRLKWKGALILGISMVPRAEITMIIMDRARSAYKELISGKTYSAMVFVVLLTCIIAPPVLGFLIRRWPSGEEP